MPPTTASSVLAFTPGLGCADEVLTCDAVATLPAGVPAVCIDFSGSVGLRACVHQNFGDGLTCSGSGGGTHWGASGLQQRTADALAASWPRLGRVHAAGDGGRETQASGRA